ncbi:NADP-dependent oxidoreductase domain-containing protein [Kockovaella imperatae]|uniref:NADP-dependent oxidoreductase domain-containing protein n=1 Tax=Kockovaella imperatae TaxID=4999 RepID=A0A1Y1US40_9TREE|nr:NADP-dependent oxidoreductase domain-containing protein [Kockovaella imperatae]ORX40314.1 NADP-dependent oxidoreductase domain-containing protein [Kockovaella imperatae]
MMDGRLSLGSTVRLTSGAEIPQLGFGVYLSPPEVTERSVKWAIEAGYRHIDSAQWYFNEEQVGEALRTANVPRSDLFVTTKLGHPDQIEHRLRESVEKIHPGADGYVDLMLIHSPTAGPEGRREQWKIMESLVKEGKIKSIGVSNYGLRHLKEMQEYAKIPPAVNQIELHPWCQQKDIVSYCQERGIALEAYSPLVQGTRSSDPYLTAIAEECGKSWAQVLIRWSLQRGFIPLPKSDTRSRIIDNTDVFDFELNATQMSQLDSLDRDEHVCINNTNVP